MKNKFRLSLVVFLIVVLGCFTSIFAADDNDGAKIGIPTITTNCKTATCMVTVKPKAETRAVLTINLVNATSEKYDLSMYELNNFVKWYDASSRGKASAYYTFSPTHTVDFDNIVSYVIQEYIK